MGFQSKSWKFSGWGSSKSVICMKQSWKIILKWEVPDLFYEWATQRRQDQTAFFLQGNRYHRLPTTSLSGDIFSTSVMMEVAPESGNFSGCPQDLSSRWGHQSVHRRSQNSALSHVATGIPTPLQYSHSISSHADLKFKKKMEILYWWAIYLFISWYNIHNFL